MEKNGWEICPISKKWFREVVMSIVLMEFNNGDLTQAEAFTDIESMIRWLEEDYFSAPEEENMLDIIVKDIRDQLKTMNIINLGNYSDTCFSAVVYTNYTLI